MYLSRPCGRSLPSPNALTRGYQELRRRRSYSFIPTERLTSPQALTRALHRAVVEVFTLQQAGRPMGDVCNISNVFFEDITAGVQVKVDGRGVVSLEYPSED